MSVTELPDTVLNEHEEKQKPPSMYRVMLLNDDYTPMNFVVGVLQAVFNFNREQATQIMMQVHRDGMGVCGVFVREIAEMKVEAVLKLAEEYQHPLQCVMDAL